MNDCYTKTGRIVRSRGFHISGCTGCAAMGHLSCTCDGWKVEDCEEIERTDEEAREYWERDERERCLGCRQKAPAVEWGDSLVCQNCGLEYEYMPITPTI